MPIPPGQKIANAVRDITHSWTICLSALCVDHRGQRYIKLVEVAPQGNYLAAGLTEAIEQSYRTQIDECSPNHLVASGWIAIPSAVSLDEDQAARVFDAVSAWDQQRAA